MELRPWMERITIRVGSWNAPQMVVTVILVIAVLSPLPASSVGRDLAVRTTYYVLLVASWNLLAGYAGLYSFGHVAFAAIGAYTTVLLADTVDLRPAVAFLAGGAVAAGVGILLGLLSSRIRGPYLVVASFGLLVAVQTVVLANPSTTGGAGGSVVPVSFSTPDRELRFYFLGLTLLAVFFGLTILLLRSPAGHVITALRDDEDGAIAIGINPLPWKTGIFAYTSMWAGLAGVFLAYYTGFVAPSIGGVPEMSIVVALGVAGGLGRLVGPAISTAILLFLSDQLRTFGQGYSSLLFGLVLLFVVVAMPWIRHRRQVSSSSVRDSASVSIEEVDAGHNTEARV